MVILGNISCSAQVFRPKSGKTKTECPLDPISFHLEVKYNHCLVYFQCQKSEEMQCQCMWGGSPEVNKEQDRYAVEITQSTFLHRACEELRAIKERTLRVLDLPVRGTLWDYLIMERKSQNIKNELCYEKQHAVVERTTLWKLETLLKLKTVLQLLGQPCILGVNYAIYWLVWLCPVTQLLVAPVASSTKKGIIHMTYRNSVKTIKWDNVHSILFKQRDTTRSAVNYLSSQTHIFCLLCQWSP